MHFFIYKEGVYGHGVFWIGDNAQAGVLELARLAEQDSDNYHYWVLYEFVPQNNSSEDASHRVIHRAKKTPPQLENL